MGREQGAAAAVVIGLDSITGLQTARLLAARGIPVVGVARDDRHFACRTRACDRVVFGATSGDELVSLLERLGPSFARPAVLFPCSDLSVLAVAVGRERLASAYRMVLPPPGVIEILVDKARFHEHAVAAGLPVANGRVLRTRADAEEAAATLAFPCVLKPSLKTSRWLSHTAAKVVTATGPGDLLRAFDRFHPWCEALVAQEWIEGADDGHFTCNAYFDATSRLVLNFVSQKLRQWPLTGGVGCLSQACADETVRLETERVFQGLGHHGLAYLEMKRDGRTGRQVIIEPNVGRPTGRSAAADLAGVELLYAQYRDALGLPLPSAPATQPDGRKWIYLRQDLQSAFRHWQRGELTMAGWARSLRGCRGDAVWSWRDPAPFLADLTRAAAQRRRGKPAGRIVDHDVHGIVGVRLVDATPAEAALVARQIGPPRGALSRPPDIIVRFVDRLPIEGLRWIEFGRTGFTDEGFFVLQSGKRPSRVRLSFDDGAGRCELVCQRGVRKIPHLIGLVTLSALKHGCAPLHASAFRHQGVGVLVTGWAKGGKTEALLAFSNRGAEYVGDEWILLSPDGRSMYGLPEHIRLQDWHLRRLTAVARRVPLSRRLFFRGVRAADAAYGALPRRIARLPLLGLIGEAMPALRRQLNVQLDPLEVFGSPSSFAGRPDAVFLMVSDEEPTVRVERTDPELVARRMAASVSYEQLPLFSAYLASRFAFPDRRVAWMEDAGRVQAQIVRSALKAKDAFIVRHPYPVDLDQLYEAMAPFCGGSVAPGRASAVAADGHGGLELEEAIHAGAPHA